MNGDAAHRAGHVLNIQNSGSRRFGKGITRYGKQQESKKSTHIISFSGRRWAKPMGLPANQA
jgi:hypothetical protein